MNNTDTKTQNNEKIDLITIPRKLLEEIYMDYLIYQKYTPINTEEQNITPQEEKYYTQTENNTLDKIRFYLK